MVLCPVRQAPGNNGSRVFHPNLKKAGLVSISYLLSLLLKVSSAGGAAPTHSWTLTAVQADYARAGAAVPACRPDAAAVLGKCVNTPHPLHRCLSVHALFISTKETAVLSI